MHLPGKAGDATVTTPSDDAFESRPSAATSARRGSFAVVAATLVLGCGHGSVSPGRSPEGACRDTPVDAVFRDRWVADPDDARRAYHVTVGTARGWLEFFGLCALRYHLDFTLDPPRASPETAKEYQMPAAYVATLHLAVRSPGGALLSDASAPVVFTSYDDAPFNLRKFDNNLGSAVTALTTGISFAFGLLPGGAV